MSFFIFLNAWFLSLFLAFPFSIRMGDKRQDIEYQAAPQEILWKRMFSIATVLAVFFTLALAFITKSGMFHL